MLKDQKAERVTEHETERKKHGPKSARTLLSHSFIDRRPRDDVDGSNAHSNSKHRKNQFKCKICLHVR